jgi:hypothetical protein
MSAGPDRASHRALSRGQTCRSYETHDGGQCQVPCSDGEASCPAEVRFAFHASNVPARLRTASLSLGTGELATSGGGRPAIKRQRRELMLWMAPGHKSVQSGIDLALPPRARR